MATGKSNDKGVVQMTVEHAVALHLNTRETYLTAKQCLKELLEAVKALVNNDKLTLQNLKQSLKKWLTEGWVTVSSAHLQVTHSGRAQVKKLAEAAAEIPLPA